jgi:hypothetical protein
MATFSSQSPPRSILVTPAIITNRLKTVFVDMLQTYSFVEPSRLTDFLPLDFK